MKGKLFLFLFLISCFSNFTFNIWAQSPSSEATPTPAPEAEEDVMGDKIQEIRDAVKEKVREKIEEAKQGPKRAFAGEVVTLAENTLTLKTRGGNQTVQLTEETAIIGRNRENLALTDLAVGDYLIAMGYRPEGDVLQAARIVLSTPPQVSRREVAFGIVTDISSEEKILTVKNEKKGITYMVDAANAKLITKKIDGNIEKTDFADISLDDRLVAIGDVSTNAEKIINAKIIHVIPGLAVGQQTTPEPTPTGSPTTTPTLSE